RFRCGPALDSRIARCTHRRRAPGEADSALQPRFPAGNGLKDAFKAPRLRISPAWWQVGAENTAGQPDLYRRIDPDGPFQAASDIPSDSPRRDARGGDFPP